MHSNMCGLFYYINPFIMHTGLYIIDCGWPVFALFIIVLCVFAPKRERTTKALDQPVRQPIKTESNVINKRRYNF